MIPASLKTEAELGRRLLDSIAEALNGDEDLRADTDEGETAFMEALDRTHDRIKAIEAVAQSDEDRAADLKARAERRRGAVDRIRDEIASCMADLQLNKIQRPDATYSLQSGREKVRVTDEATVPDELCKVTRKPDLTAIGKELKAGREVPGAIIEQANKPVLVIRGAR